MGRLPVWAALVASLSANAVVAVSAARHRMQPASRGEPLIFSRAALDAAQRARILELRAELVVKRDARARALGDLRAQLAAAVVRAPNDRAALESLLARVSESQAAFQRDVVEHVLAVRAVLHPDQRRAFEDVIATQLREGGALHGEGAGEGSR